MKNIAIGNADGRIGKPCCIPLTHPTPGNIAKSVLWKNMAESAKAATDFFGKQIIYINVLRNMSVDCDCAGLAAAPPTTPDIGILLLQIFLPSIRLLSTLFLLYQYAAKHDLQERIESRRGLRQLSYMKELSMG